MLTVNMHGFRFATVSVYALKELQGKNCDVPHKRESFSLKLALRTETGAPTENKSEKTPQLEGTCRWGEPPWVFNLTWDGFCKLLET